MGLLRQSQLFPTLLKDLDQSYRDNSKITETINSIDFNTGYQYSVTGSGITADGNLSPGTGTNSVTIDGVTSRWTEITDRPTFRQSTPGAAFQFTETYSVLVYKIKQS